MDKVRSIFSRITIEHIWVITVLAGIIAFLNTHPIRPHDFWWHVAIGRDIVVAKAIPLFDVYSFTRYGLSYPSYQQFWLTEALLYLIYNAGGPILVILIQTLVISSAYIVLMLTCQRIALNWRAVAFSLLFAAALGFGNWNVRPQAISYLYGAIILLGITEYRTTHHRGWFFLFPITMALWVNSHGSFPIGLVMIGIWLADESWRTTVRWVRTREWYFNNLIPVGISLALAIAGCVINPRGFGFVGYLTMMAGNNIVQNFILEWMPPTYNSLEGLIFYALFMASAVLLAISPKRPSVSQLLTFLIFGLLGLKYIRGIIWFGIAMAPVVAYHLGSVFEQIGLKPAGIPNEKSKRLNAIFVSAMVLLVIFSLPWFKPYWPVVPAKRGLIAAETPVKATQFMLEKHLSPEVFHDMAFGSFLIWNAQPMYKVFVDSRVELYPVEIWDDYLIIGNAVGDWQEKLSEYNINTLMLHPENQAGLIAAAEKSTNWEEVFKDEAAVVFSRRVAE